MSAQDANSLPWNPDSKSFPSLKQLPKLPNAPEDAAWVWGEDDNIGRLNLLTPSRVLAASKLIETGEIVPTNLPLNVPATPAFARKPFKLEIKALAPGLAYDDLYELNTQSGTQWDGFRHFACMSTSQFYNGTTGEDIEGPKANHKCSIHHWAEHGIAGRGVLIDYLGYAQKTGKTYDAFDNHGITFEELVAAGKDQGLNILPKSQGGDIEIGDILFVRSGFVRSYYAKSEKERHDLAVRPHQLGPDDGQRYAGVKQGEEMKNWLHDSYFAAVAGDAPAFEAWPSHTDYYLHEYLLARWGMPIGEMLDLEKLSETCRKSKRWTFFFTAAPFNTPGGVSSHVNGTALF